MTLNISDGHYFGSFTISTMYFRLPDDHFSFHQPPSSKMAGVINPRKLIKAQHTIASSKYGCELIDGQVDKITRIKANDDDKSNSTSIFVLDVTKYSDPTTPSLKGISDNITQIRTKRVILATGVYTNITPLLQVSDQHFKTRRKKNKKFP